MKVSVALFPEPNENREKLVADRQCALYDSTRTQEREEKRFGKQIGPDAAKWECQFWVGGGGGAVRMRQKWTAI